MKNALYFGLASLALGLGVATTVQAATDHAWVSRNGSDSGNTTCPVTAPCRTLANAHTYTNPGGTISILDSGEYTALTITKAITIKASAGVDATITGVSNGSNIRINAGASDVVVLEGLTLDGGTTGISGNVIGVYLASGAAVYVLNCTIKNDNYGVVNASSTPNARAIIQRSNLLRNRKGAVVANVSATGTAVISVLDSLIDGSTDAGVSADTGTIIGVARTVINAGPVAIDIFGTGQVISVGPSNVVSGTGSFTATIPLN